MADIAPECTATDSTASSKRPKITKKAGKGTEDSKSETILEKTSADIKRIANTFCADDEVVHRRGNIYSDINAMVGLSANHRHAASLKLMSDDRATQLFYQIPTEEEKLQFLLAFIN